jgi:hypothetical protein
MFRIERAPAAAMHIALGHGFRRHERSDCKVTVEVSSAALAHLLLKLRGFV